VKCAGIPLASGELPEKTEEEREREREGGGGIANWQIQRRMIVKRARRIRQGTSADDEMFDRGAMRIGAHRGLGNSLRLACLSC